MDCYPESRLAGTVFCGGVNEPHAIEGNPKLQEAFEEVHEGLSDKSFVSLTFPMFNGV